MRRNRQSLQNSFSWPIRTELDPLGPLKRVYHGTFYRLSEKYLNRCVTQFTGNHSRLDYDTIDQMIMVVQKIPLWLKYMDLIA